MDVIVSLPVSCFSLHPVIKKSKELFCQRPSVGAGSTFLLSPEPAGLNLRSRTGPLTDSETCPRCWFCQSQPTRVGSVQWKPPRSSLTHKVNMTRWRTSSLTTDLNILLICLSQPGLRVKATVMAARGKPGGRKNAPEQIDPAVMINVTLHPAVTIRGCCVFEEWSLIRAVLVKPPVSRSCVLSDCLMYELLGGKSKRRGFLHDGKRRHVDFENRCWINIWQAAPTSIVWEV